MKRLLLLGTLALVACSQPETLAPATPPERPSILLVTLDTTRADSIGPEAKDVQTPAFNALASRGRRYRFAYATVPQTLPSHASMMTGLYPAGHGVRENARFLDASHPLVAERLRTAGYGTAAFVSAFAVARRFGLGRGFDVYDEDFGQDRAERNAKETTDRALAWLQNAPTQQPLFLWVHYYDPHYPYTPPEPYSTRYAAKPYLGEVAAMDEQLGRLVEAFEKRGMAAIAVVADHGEGLGEHGEQQHGNLLYQTTMHVPLVLAGPAITAGMDDTPVSTRRIFHTLLDWAGIDKTQSLVANERERVIVGEAMKPFLDYGWQPQVMAVEGQEKTIKAGRLEVYDVVADPGETRNVAAQRDLSRLVRATLLEYPIPSTKTAEPPATLDEESRRKLASLGYVSSTAKPVIRADAPNPADMAALFPILDSAAALFVAERYAEAVPLLEKILETDPTNLDTALRLATSHSSLGHDGEALTAFRRAQAIAPESSDVRTYLALHLARGSDWQRAVPMLEQVLAETPNKVPALEALALVRERQGNAAAALELRKKLHTLRAPSAAELLAMGNLAMQTEQTPLAIESFEKARALQGPAFRHDLELGVVLLAAGRLAEARAALDRVPRSHPAYPMALFKRAQVSVLLHETDAAARIAAARANANEMTRELIAREKLFQ
ncbi:MAG TPA: sulfatase-like hydrolase/transferase [Thermoanaerobaculia bacterium]|nr:sulfatase-like hydrolase/transferase [Thermoanaerobaculia bacterium]